MLGLEFHRLTVFLLQCVMPANPFLLHSQLDFVFLLFIIAFSLVYFQRNVHKKDGREGSRMPPPHSMPLWPKHCNELRASEKKHIEQINKQTSKQKILCPPLVAEKQDINLQISPFFLPGGTKVSAQRQPKLLVWWYYFC